MYLMEFFGLAGFVFIAGLLTIFLEHPDMPVMKSSLKNHDLLRRIPLGIILGAYITLVSVLFGKKSGAHINPCVSWTFFRLGKINFADALLFTIAQFAGAVAAGQLLKYMMGGLFSHPIVNYGNAEPRPPYGTITAFIAEFIISFILMLVVLMASSSRRFEKYVGLLSGVIIALYLIIEVPFSGMSLNPARSFAGSLAANRWGYLWLYFVAPLLAMLAAGEVFLGWRGKQVSQTGMADNPSGTIFIQSDYKEISRYPVE